MRAWDSCEAERPRICRSTVSAPSSAREKPAPPFSLQVRSLDPQVFHIETHSSDTILSINGKLVGDHAEAIAFMDTSERWVEVVLTEADGEWDVEGRL